MIEFPPTPAPNGCEPSLIDYGGTLRPAFGGKLQRIDRLGSRFRVELSYPPLVGAAGRVFVSRLLRAKREGLRIPYPLLSVNQGNPGNPVLNGAPANKYQIPVKGLTPGYSGGEGYWLSLVRDGQHYLYNVTAAFTANAGGQATISIYPGLRVPMLDGDAVHLAQPMLEGLVDGDEARWNLSLAHHINFTLSIEEAA